jgi:hypothetical protein
MTCWFCAVRESEEKHIYGIDMYGQVGVQGNAADTNVAYNVRHIDVPRCADCHSKHRTAKAARIMSVVFLVILAGGALSAAFQWVPDLIAGLWCGLAAGLLIACLISPALVQKGIKSLRKSRRAFPEVAELLQRQYRFGLRPKEERPKAQQPSVQPSAAQPAQPPAAPDSDSEENVQL